MTTQTNLPLKNIQGKVGFHKAGEKGKWKVAVDLGNLLFFPQCAPNNGHMKVGMRTGKGNHLRANCTLVEQL